MGDQVYLIVGVAMSGKRHVDLLSGSEVLSNCEKQLLRHCAKADSVWVFRVMTKKNVVDHGRGIAWDHGMFAKEMKESDHHIGEANQVDSIDNID